VLGVLPTKAGSIEISGADPFSAIKLWPGEISYVPQEPYISDSTLIENIAMGFPPKEINIERVNTCIELASLSGVVKELDGGLNFQVGERGSKLSGGQRQRLAIARALYTNPSLVILDEATSALDEATEEEITKAIERLKGIVTLVVISHRLSVVKNLDSVIVLESGKILEHAPFSQLNSTRKGITQK
jgi:ABC-type bacteriocin/lantibiotic exporter with double-glycine peptidase domain